MQIHGFNKTTLLDYPGHLACTIFLGNCNFRCPFCHNGSLVINPESEPVISEEYIFSYLTKRKNILEGVCITGGEPTLASDLYDFILKIKSIGLKIKLDTNGYRPDVIKDLLSTEVIDYIAMDIKSSPSNYSKLIGLPAIDIEKIKYSVRLIMDSDIDYEFRTTLIKELHNTNDIKDIGQWIKGCKAYFLQPYKETDNVIHKGFSSYPKEELYNFKKILNNYINKVEIRGID